MKDFKQFREQIEIISEEKIPVEHVVKSVRKVLGQDGANRFINHLKPGTDKHTTWSKTNSALMKQGVKPKHIADISVHVRPAQFKEEVDLEEAVKVGDTITSGGKNITAGVVKKIEDGHAIVHHAKTNTLHKVPLEHISRENIVREEAELEEAKGALTYTPKVTKYAVIPDSRMKFVKHFDKKEDAEAHAQKHGGKVKPVDQAGRTMKEDVELEEMWRVEKSEATGRHHVVKGYNEKRKVWTNKTGAGDFNSESDAKKKAEELNSVKEATLPPHLAKLIKDKQLDKVPMKHVTPRPEKQSHTIKDVTPKGYGPTKEEVETIEEGPYSSGQLKPTKDMEDQEKKAVTSRTSTMRARDSKGVYTATMKDGKEVSRVYEEEQIDEVSLDYLTNKDYIRKAEGSRKAAQNAQRFPGASKETKEKASQTEKKREKGMASYTKRFNAAHPRPKFVTAAKPVDSYPLGGYDPVTRRSYSEEVDLEEATAFSLAMKKAISAHERGDRKRAMYHLDNAKTARYTLKSTEVDKDPELHKKYKELRDKYSQKSGDYTIKHDMVGNAKVVHEEVELEEAVEVSHDRYMRSHGKQASGTGNWMFTHKRMGDVDYKNSSEVHSSRGSFSDAKKSAQKWAKENGHRTVYVMESTEEKILSFSEYRKM